MKIGSVLSLSSSEHGQSRWWSIVPSCIQERNFYWISNWSNMISRCVTLWTEYGCHSFLQDGTSFSLSNETAILDVSSNGWWCTYLNPLHLFPVGTLTISGTRYLPGSIVGSMLTRWMPYLKASSCFTSWSSSKMAAIRIWFGNTANTGLRANRLRKQCIDFILVHSIVTNTMYQSHTQPQQSDFEVEQLKSSYPYRFPGALQNCFPCETEQQERGQYLGQNFFPYSSGILPKKCIPKFLESSRESLNPFTLTRQAFPSYSLRTCICMLHNLLTL